MEPEDWRLELPGFTDERYVSGSGYVSHLSALDLVLGIEIALIFSGKKPWTLMVSKGDNLRRDNVGFIELENAHIQTAIVEGLDALAIRCVAYDLISRS